MSKVVKKLKYKVSDTELSDDIYFKVDNGEGLDYVDNKLKVKPATQSALGGVKPDGTSITIDLDGTIHSGAGSLEAGEGISIIDNKINTKVDGQTVFFNQQGQLSSTGGGGGGVGSLTRDLIVNQLNGVLFDKDDLASNIYEIETHNDLLLLSMEGVPIQWSIDGAIWSFGTSINGGYFLRSFDIAGTKYAYMSARNSAQYSADGKTWTDYNIPGVSNYWNMCSNGRALIQGTDKGVYFTEDGITWVATDLTTGGYGRYNIAYGNERFVVGGADGIYYSDDGLHWNKGDYTGNQLNGITYGTTGFVAYSGNNSVGYYYSADGQHWEKTNVEEGVSGDVVFGQGYFLGCLSGIGMFYSDDGKNWTQTSVAKNSFVNGADIQTFKFIRGMWIGCGNKGIFYSTDGKNWYPSNITDTTYDAVYFNNSIFVTGDKTKYIYKYTPSSVIDGNNIANATKTEAGVVKPDGITIDITADGILSALGESSSTIVNKINVSPIQVFGSQVSKANSFNLGVVRPDNQTTFVNTDGVLSAVGVTPDLIPGQGISIDGDTISLKVDGETLTIDTQTGKLTLVDVPTNNKIKSKSFGDNYQGGQGILVQDEMISINNDERYLGFTEDGALTLIPPNTEADKGTIMNGVGDYSSGNGIVINENNVITVKVDNNYIGFDVNGRLKVLKKLSPQSFDLISSPTQFSYADNLSQPYFANNLWVYGADGIWYSTDGKTWTQTSITNTRKGNFCYGNGLWVFHSNYIYTSTDGKTWTKTDTQIDGHTTPCFYNGIWVISSFPNSQYPSKTGVYYSTDGVNWTKSNLDDQYWTSPCCYNGMWVIGGCPLNSSTNLGIWYSTDGKNWQQTEMQQYTWSNIDCKNGLWVAASKSEHDVWSSTNGTNWTITNISFGDKLTMIGDLSYHDGVWVGCFGSSSEKGRLEYTTDGVNWHTTNLGTQNPSAPACYNNGIWITISDTSLGDGVYYSLDGKTWELLLATPLIKPTSYIKAQGNMFVFVPYFHSTDNKVCYGYPLYLLKQNPLYNSIYNTFKTSQQFDSLFQILPISIDTTHNSLINLFLTLKDGKTTLANQGDEIIGIIQQGESQISIIGCLTVQDDGTCVVGQKCNVSHDGIATLSEDGYIVLERLEDNLVKIIFK